MNATLHDLFKQAEEGLDRPGQDQLAELVAAFLATHSGPAPFSPEDLAHLRQIDREAFDAADPAEVAELFGRRG